MGELNPEWVAAYREFAAAQAAYREIAPPAQLPSHEVTDEVDPRLRLALQTCLDALSKAEATQRYLD